jgi:hypothetical protein
MEGDYMREHKYKAWDKKNKLMWNVARIDFNPLYVELCADLKQPVKDCP